MTLLERLNLEVCCDPAVYNEIRRALAIAQVVERKSKELHSLSANHAKEFLAEADELLEGK